MIAFGHVTLNHHRMENSYLTAFTTTISPARQSVDLFLNIERGKTSYLGCELAFRPDAGMPAKLTQTPLITFLDV